MQNSSVPATTGAHDQERLAKAMALILVTANAVTMPAFKTAVIYNELMAQLKVVEAMQAKELIRANKYPADPCEDEYVNILMRLVGKKSPAEILDCAAKIQIFKQNHPTEAPYGEIFKFIGIENLKQEVLRYVQNRIGSPKGQFAAEQVWIVFNGGLQAIMNHNVFGISVEISHLSTAEKEKLTDSYIAANKDLMGTLQPVVDDCLNNLKGGAAAVSSIISVEFWGDELPSDAVIEVNIDGNQHSLKPSFITSGSETRLFLTHAGKESGLLNIASLNELGKTPITIVQKHHTVPVTLKISKDDIKPDERIRVSFAMKDGVCHATAKPCQPSVVPIKARVLQMLTNILAEKSTHMLCVMHLGYDPQVRKQAEDMAKNSRSSNPSNMVSHMYAGARSVPVQRTLGRIPFAGESIVRGIYNQDAMQAQTVDDFIEGLVAKMSPEEKEKWREVVINAIKQQLSQLTDETVEASYQSIVAVKSQGDLAIFRAIGKMLGYDGWYKAYYQMLSAAAHTMSETEKQTIASNFIQVLFGLSPAPTIATVATTTANVTASPFHSTSMGASSSNEPHVGSDHDDERGVSDGDEVSAEQGEDSQGVDEVTGTLNGVSISPTATISTTSTALSTNTVSTATTPPTQVNGAAQVAQQQQQQEQNWENRTGSNKNQQQQGQGEGCTVQ